jgi:hypothetical protein
MVYRPPVRIVTWDEVRTRRLARGHLLERAPAEGLVEVVRDVGGIQAQVTAAAELSLAARVEGIAQEDVRAALWERRELVKTWTLRGTLHLHPADELALWIAARRAVLGEADAEGGTPDRIAEVVEAIGEALRGKRLLREELADEVVRRVGAWPRERLASGWGFFLGDAAAAGLLCFGPPQGQKVSFVRPDEWLGPQPEIESRAALAEVARRYLSAYGPVTHSQFREWFGSRSFKAPDALRLFESLGDELVEADVEGRPARLLAADPDLSRAPVRGHVRLLPEYDAFVMGFRERDRLVPEAVRAQVAAHGKGRYEGPAGTPFLLVDGVCAGIWSRTRRGKRVELRVEPARRLTRPERAGLEAEAARIGDFLRAVPHLHVV